MSEEPNVADAALHGLAALVTDYYLCGGPALDWTTFLSWGETHRALARELYPRVREAEHRQLAALVAQALGAPPERIAEAIGGALGDQLMDRAATARAARDMVGAPPAPDAAVSARRLARNEVHG